MYHASTTDQITFHQSVYIDLENYYSIKQNTHTHKIREQKIIIKLNELLHI